MMSPILIKFVKLQILSFCGAGIVLLFLVLNTRVYTELIIQENIVEVRIDDESKEEAERRNLSMIEKKNSSGLTYTKAKNVDVPQTFTHAQFDHEFVNNFKLDKEMRIDVEEKNISKGWCKLHISYKILQEVNWEINHEKLIENLSKIISEKDLEYIFFSKEFTKIKNFQSTLQQLQKYRTENDLKIGIFTYPIWGKEVNYRHFFQVKNDLVKVDNIKTIENLVDFWIVNGFEFTNEYSILPFRISEIDLIERSIQFLISEKVPRSKIILNLTTKSYQWPKREIPKKYSENYTWFESQAEIVKSDVENLILINEQLNNHFFKSIDGEKIVVKLNEKFYQDAISIAHTYGIWGVNFE